MSNRLRPFLYRRAIFLLETFGMEPANCKVLDPDGLVWREVYPQDYEVKQ